MRAEWRSIACGASLETLATPAVPPTEIASVGARRQEVRAVTATWRLPPRNIGAQARRERVRVAPASAPAMPSRGRGRCPRTTPSPRASPQTVHACAERLDAALISDPSAEHRPRRRVRHRARLRGQLGTSPQR